MTTQLKPGQSVPVLDNGNLTAGNFTTPARLAPGYNGDVVLTILNLTANAILLSVSADGGTTFVPFEVAGTQVSIATETAISVNLSSAFAYAFSSATNITAGTIWVGR